MSLEQSLMQSTAMAILNSDTSQAYQLIQTIENSPSKINAFLDRETESLDRKLDKDAMKSIVKKSIFDF